MDVNFGAIPHTTITVTVAGSKITLTGPVNEVTPATTIISLLNSAVTAAAKGQIAEANAALKNAKSLLPATGSLRSKVAPAVAKIEKEMPLPPGMYAFATGPSSDSVYNAPGASKLLVG